MALVLPKHENEVSDKRVESILFPRLDEGSNPSWSTNRILIFKELQKSACQNACITTSYSITAMSNFARAQEENKERRAWERTTKEILSKYFFDISKLIFTAFVLGCFVPLLSDEEFKINWTILICGLLATITFAIFGYKILKRQ